MKKGLILLISLALMFSLAGCSGSADTSNKKSGSNSTQYKDGTYTAAGKGKAGDVKVEVKIAEGKLTEINVLDNKETPAMMDSVKQNLIPEIIKKQTTKGVDAVSGATLASNAVLEAVGKAQNEALNK